MTRASIMLSWLSLISQQHLTSLSMKDTTSHPCPAIAPHYLPDTHKLEALWPERPHCRAHLHSEEEDVDHATPHTQRATMTHWPPVPSSPGLPHPTDELTSCRGRWLGLCSERSQPSTVRRTSVSFCDAVWGFKTYRVKSFLQCRGGDFSNLLPQTNAGSQLLYGRSETMQWFVFSGTDIWTGN